VTAAGRAARAALHGLGPGALAGAAIALAQWLGASRLLGAVAVADVAAGALLGAAAGFALRLAGLARLDELLPRFSKAALAAAAALSAWVLLAERSAIPLPEEPSVASAPAPDRRAILIVLDTLRRDRVSLYGYPRATTPELDRFAREALVFEDASATAPYTLPTHASMFTGLHSRSHGARLERTDSGRRLHGLDTSALTLAERAQQAGYRTAAIVSNFAYAQEAPHGLEQGFGLWLAERPRVAGPRFAPALWLLGLLGRRPPRYAQEPLLFDAEAITDAAIRWLDRHAGEPFFLLLNYMDVHQPLFLRDGEPAPHDPAELEVEDISPEQALRWLEDPARAEALRVTLSNRYDRHLRRLDAGLGRLFRHLEASGLLAKATVIVTADHGEYLGEHGLAFHVLDLHAPVVNVPLIARGPGFAPGRTQRPTQSTDLFPTLLEALALPVPADVQGVSLQLPQTRPIVSELYSQYHGFLLRPPFAERFDRIARSIRFDRYRLIEHSNGRAFLFDLESDPEEAHDLAGELPDRVADGREALRRWLDATPEARQTATPEAQLTEEEKARLRALGYLD
jgi:arylsulfatase A-like enzyme